MKIIHTHPNDPDFKYFEELKRIVYQNEDHHPLLSDKINLDCLYTIVLLLENDKPLAGLAIYHQHSLTHEGKSVCTFGNYECVNNAETAKLLLEHALHVAGQLGTGFVIGPMNGTTWDDYRFSLNFDVQRFFLEPYHQPYYNDHFLKAGFEVLGTYCSSIDKNIITNVERVTVSEQNLLRAGVRIREIDMTKFDMELKKLHTFLQTAFAKNFLFSPISLEQFIKKYKEAVSIIQPEWVLLAEDQQDKIIGFIFCYEDKLAPSNEKKLIVKTVARDPAKVYSGLGQVMFVNIMNKAKERGISSLIHAFMIEDSDSNKISTNFKGESIKKYALYGKSI